LHHAGLDVSFLKKACARWARIIPGFIVLDTMRIEYRQRKRREIPVKQGDLQLGRIRSLYGLPRYTAHNALNDAFATAELLLAIAASMERNEPLRLTPHLKFF
jgi:DNA polymerase-3 subunit epsilon